MSSSSSIGSQILTSDDESSSDSGEIAGNFNCPTERHGEEHSAVHEVVCGRDFSNSFLKDQVYKDSWVQCSLWLILHHVLWHTEGGIYGKPNS